MDRAACVVNVAALVFVMTAAQPLRAGDNSDRVSHALSDEGAKTKIFPLVRPETKQAANEERDRYLKIAEGFLTAKARAMRPPRFAGKVIVCFHVDLTGRVMLVDLCQKSSDPRGDRFALDVVASVSPLPPPPSSLGGLVWVYAFDR